MQFNSNTSTFSYRNELSISVYDSQFSNNISLACYFFLLYSLSMMHVVNSPKLCSIQLTDIYIFLCLRFWYQQSQIYDSRQQLWFPSALGIHLPQQIRLAQWITDPNTVASHLFSVTLWLIWKGWNQLIFNKTPFCCVHRYGGIQIFCRVF